MLFLSRIFVFCFAASYSLALLLEIARAVLWRNLRPVFILGVTAAGLLAHTLYLVNRAIAADSTPLSSAFDWYVLGAWGLAVVYFYWSCHYRNSALGLFVLPLVLGLIGLAKFASREPFPQSRAGQIWGSIHGVFLLLGLVAVAMGFVAGLMYLIQSHRLKNKLTTAGSMRLPSLEWLERVNSRAILISVLMVGAGFASGIVLNMVSHRSKIDEVPWTDPVIWSTSLMFAWLLAAAIFSMLYRPARSGRKVAYLTVASFAFLAVALGLRLLLPSEHTAMIEKQKTESRNLKVEWVACEAQPPNPTALRSVFCLLPSALSLEILR
ncbi:MAG TPA: cytochrome c biogenesis protein CcsA [Pirellulales bacterium]|jgi:ABC-type uncharacterized transport system permease subunit|nr:cytochrome c biogenesis protein CcsA [Pirellulales bacterium]